MSCRHPSDPDHTLDVPIMPLPAGRHIVSVTSDRRERTLGPARTEFRPENHGGQGTASVMMTTLIRTIGQEGSAVHCVMWTYAVPPELNESAIRGLFSDVAANYLDVPGLVRKYFGFTEDAKSVIGIYLWHSKDAAQAFYTPEWMADVTARWGAAPRKDEWVVPAVAETHDGTVVVERIIEPSESDTPEVRR
jgi:hypothetical protein